MPRFLLTCQKLPCIAKEAVHALFDGCSGAVTAIERFSLSSGLYCRAHDTTDAVLSCNYMPAKGSVTFLTPPSACVVQMLTEHAM